MAKRTYKSAELCAMISTRHPTGEWVTCFEVSNATGAASTRRADAIAMNTWPSRGLAIHGFEVKVSRSDWKSELANPAKADSIARFCDYWWLVAPEDIVQSGEVPEAWGHLAPRGSAGNETLYQVKAAQKLEAIPITREFTASFLRNAARTDDADEQRRISAHINAARAKMADEIEHAVKARTERNGKAREFLEEMAGELGLDPRSWARDRDVMDVMRVVAKLDPHTLKYQMSSLNSAARQIVELTAKFDETIKRKSNPDLQLILTQMDGLTGSPPPIMPSSASRPAAD